MEPLLQYSPMEWAIKDLQAFASAKGDAERLYLLKKVKKAVEERLDILIDGIKEDCAPGEILDRGDGYGYQLVPTEKLVYGPDALAILAKHGVLDQVAVVSTAKLEKLAKAKRIDWRTVDLLKQMATVETSIVLREVEIGGNSDATKEG